MERLTELEVINRMLLGIRLAPIATVDDLDIYSEGMIARSILRQTILEELTPGWNFNTRRLTLSPEPDGTIPVPGNTIDLFVPQGNDEVMVDSDNRLVSCHDGTKVFTSSVDAFVVLGYDWSELPAPLQLLCLHKARLSFKLEMKSDAGPETSVIQGDILKAQAAAKAWDLRQKRRSALDSIRSWTHVQRRVPRW